MLLLFPLEMRKRNKYNSRVDSSPVRSLPGLGGDRVCICPFPQGWDNSDLSKQGNSLSWERGHGCRDHTAIRTQNNVPAQRASSLYFSPGLWPVDRCCPQLWWIFPTQPNLENPSQTCPQATLIRVTHGHVWRLVFYVNLCSTNSNCC